MDQTKANTLMRGAMLLTLASLISKLLSAGYRIPLQNITGDLGYYIYQQIYPFIGLVIILSLYGFPSAISKMTVELDLEGRSTSLRSFYIPIFLILLAINGILFFCLYSNAHSLSVLIGDQHLARAYQLIAFTFLFIPITSLLRGVFQGQHNMKPTAYSQVGEQLIRISIIILAAYVITWNEIDMYKIGEAAAIASILGASLSTFILVFFFIRKKAFTVKQYKIPWKYYIKTLFTLGIVASLNHLVLIIIQFADVLTLVPNLLKSGYSAMEAMEAKGIFDRGQPLIQLGTVLGSSFALAIVPAISKKKLQKEPQLFYDYIEGSLKVCFYLATGATIGLIGIFPETNVLLFQDMKGTVSLQILAVAIVLSSFSITGVSILQSSGYFIRTAGYILSAFLIKCFLNIVFVPLWGITGSAVATVLSLLILCLFILIELKAKLPQIRLFKQIDLTAFFTSNLGLALYLVLVKYAISFITLSSRVGLLFYVLFVVVTGAIIYIFLLLRCNAFTEKELQMLPFASIFIRMNKWK